MFRVGWSCRFGLVGSGQVGPRPSGIVIGATESKSGATESVEVKVEVGSDEGRRRK